MQRYSKIPDLLKAIYHPHFKQLKKHTTQTYIYKG
jgi:hypothetical protein